MILFPALAAQAATVELYRGAPIGQPGYWAVEDTYLDKAEPTQDHGGGFTLLGGDGRTVLLRFGDLNRAIGAGRRIVSATLVLTPSGGDVPQLKGVTAVDSAWGEGPLSTLTRILADAEGAKKENAAGRGAATWNERRAGIAAWGTPGTPSGTPVDAKAGPKGRTLEIAGLAATVQGWLDRPWTDHGLALAFAGDVEFFSSQSPSGRPMLVVETEPVATMQETKPDLAVTLLAKTNGKWTATVRNLGSAPAPAAKATWIADDKPRAEASVPALSPGSEATVAYGGPDPKGDSQVPSLALALAPGGADARPSNDRLDVFADAKPVTLRVRAGLDPQAVVAYWNETVAPQSRFSFAPEGVKGRVRLEGATVADDGAATLLDGLRQIGTQLGLPTVTAGGDLYPGIMGYGDTRFEGSIPGRLALPYEPYPDPATATALLEPTGLLSATDVGRLNDGTDKLPLPKVAALRMLDLSGRPLSGLQLTVEGPGVPAMKLTTNADGTALMPAVPFKPDLSNGVLTVRATQQGVTETAAVKAWRLSDSYRRSGSPVVIADVRLDLPMLPLETGTDLADGKPLVDSEGKPYALGGPLPEKPGAYVEMDLGRDRTIGEIALKVGPTFWSRYEIRTYETGGKPEEAALWAGELDEPWSLRNRGVDGWVPYRSPTQRIRFIRIVSKSGGPGTLAGLRVVPVKITGS